MFPFIFSNFFFFFCTKPQNSRILFLSYCSNILTPLFTYSIFIFRIFTVFSMPLYSHIFFFKSSFKTNMSKNNNSIKVTFFHLPVHSSLYYYYYLFIMQDIYIHLKHVYHVLVYD